MQSLRNASSLILVAPNFHPKMSILADGISVLSQKRSTNTAHFPDAYVFPGGNSDAADHAPEWLSVLPPELLNVPLNIVGFSEQSRSVAANRQHHVSQAVSSRITAIRETFEECGVLLCKRMNEKSNHKVTHLELEDSNLWREKVSKNAREFINLCRVHQCFPNICNLYFLSTWITPAHIQRRYNCKFFIAITDRQIEGKADGIEIERVEWHPVSYLLENAYLPSPQIYELSILQKFPNVDVLYEFANKVNSSECLPYVPIAVVTEDGLVIILPGDEKYEELDRSKSQNLVDANCTAEKYRGHIMNRVELIKGKGTLIIRNCFPRNQDFIDSLVSKRSKI